jgi:hypothetical protein
MKMPVTNPIKPVMALNTSLFQVCKKAMLAISMPVRQMVMQMANFTP